MFDWSVLLLFKFLHDFLIVLKNFTCMNIRSAIHGNRLGHVQVQPPGLGTVQELHALVDGDGDDLWFMDGSLHNVSDDGYSGTSDLDREWDRRHNQFHTIGYRDGLTAGKEASAQDGFVVGFKQSVLIGYKWGHVRGISSALALLPDHLREKLVKESETSEKFQNLYASVSSISSKDAVQMFHDDIMVGRVDNPHNHVADNSDVTSIPDDISGCKQLGRFSKQLESLLCECPSIEVHTAAETNAVV